MACGLLLFGCSKEYDDSALRNDLSDLENRVAKLEELCKQMNTNISSLQKIVDALQDNLSISKVEQISDGYIIHFSDGSTATIKNGKDSGTIPVIGVRKDTDGCYYWTLDGEWLTDEKGNKVKAQGTDGKDGVDGEDGNDGADGEDGTDGTNGKDGITPQLKIENGRWMLSMDDGKTWTDIGQATGADGKDGADGTDGEDGVDGKDGTNGIFKSVTEDDDNVYFTLEDDSVITIPKSDNSKFAIAFDTTDIAILNGGESKTISYTITDATENTVVKAIAQDEWKVKVNATSTDKGTITITAPNPIVESEILVFANDGSYHTVMVSLNCMQGQINIADNSIDATPAGGTQEIKLTTNLDYTVEIPDDAQSWLSLAPETRALREDIIAFNISANEGIQRFATVALRDEQGNILQTIIFRQLGTCTEIHVETKGELENELAGYDYANIESLKITGVLNDVDFLFIYRMKQPPQSLQDHQQHCCHPASLLFVRTHGKLRRFVLVQRGQIFQRGDAEGAQKHIGGSEADGMPRQIQAPGLFDQALIDHFAYDRAGIHAAHLLNKAARYRLVVGNDRQHLQRSGAERHIAAIVHQALYHFAVLGAAGHLPAVLQAQQAHAAILHIVFIAQLHQQFFHHVQLGADGFGQFFGGHRVTAGKKQCFNGIFTSFLVHLCILLLFQAAVIDRKFLFVGNFQTARAHQLQNRQKGGHGFASAGGRAKQLTQSAKFSLEHTAQHMNHP